MIWCLTLILKSFNTRKQTCHIPTDSIFIIYFFIAPTHISRVDMPSCRVFNRMKAFLLSEPNTIFPINFVYTMAWRILHIEKLRIGEHIKSRKSVVCCRSKTENLIASECQLHKNTWHISLLCDFTHSLLQRFLIAVENTR